MQPNAPQQYLIRKTGPGQTLSRIQFGILLAEQQNFKAKLSVVAVLI